MELADIVIKRIEEEENTKKLFNALIGFSKENVGVAISKISQLFTTGRQKRSTLTLLNLLEDEEISKIEDINIYRANLPNKIVGEQDGAEKITTRTFIKQSDNFASDIGKTADEQNCDFIFLGMGPNVFNTPLWDKYIKLKQNNLATEEDYINELGQQQTKTLRVASNLLAKSDKSVGVLVGDIPETLSNIFVPILREEDLIILTHISQIAKSTNLRITVWDAIGVIENNNKIQKLFSSISKKAESKVRLWNNDKKITIDFINEQDLMVIARTGWEKLICTPLCWIKSMPSTLIIKDKKR